MTRRTPNQLFSDGIDAVNRVGCKIGLHKRTEMWSGEAYDYRGNYTPARYLHPICATCWERLPEKAERLPYGPARLLVAIAATSLALGTWLFLLTR